MNDCECLPFLFIWASWGGSNSSAVLVRSENIHGYHCNQLLPDTAGVLHGEARYEWRKRAPKIDTLEMIVFKYVIYIICINIIYM